MVEMTESINAVARCWLSSAVAGLVNSCTSGAPGSQAKPCTCVRTATVLLLKPQPIVLGTKDVPVKALEELLESLIETAGLSMTA